MKKINILTTLFLAITFTACEKEIEFTGKVSKPLMVVNSIISSDSVISAYITKSKFFLENDETFDNVNNADVSVYINGVFKEKMANTQDGLYQTSFIPNQGDTVEIKATASGLDDVNSKTIVSYQPDIISLDTTLKSMTITPNLTYSSVNGGPFTVDTTGYSVNFDLNVKIKIKDNGSINNSYRLEPSLIYPNDSSKYFYSNSVYTTFDGILSENQNGVSDFLDISGSYNMYGIFTDEIFNGKEFTVSCTIHCSLYYSLSNLHENYLYINLQEINSDYYNYLYTRDMSINSEGPFSEPVQIYSNINGGIGILGSYSNSNNSTKINLEALVQTHVNLDKISTSYKMKHIKR